MKINKPVSAFFLGALSAFLILMVMGNRPNEPWGKYHLTVKDDAFYVLNTYTGEIKVRGPKYVIRYDWASDYAEGKLTDLKLK